MSILRLPKRFSILVHALPFLILISLLAPVAGYRHIWQDEAETAERARSILAFGIPKTVDSQGRLSLNTGGLEIEETELHRYTPWLQFYLGAAGLAAGRAVGLSDDSSLRMPSIVLHGLTSSCLSYALTTTLALHPLAGVSLATLFGVQSVRILHNRSARYHALLDFLFLAGLLALGFQNRDRKAAVWIGSAALFLLPMVHTLGGSLLSSTLVLGVVAEALVIRRLSFAGVFKKFFWPILFPPLLSLLLLLWLTRPWLHGFWSPEEGLKNFRSLKSGFEISYAFYPYAIAMIFLFWRRMRAQAAVMAAILFYLLVAGRALDLYPFSQPRYYLSVPIILLFWPVLINWDPKIRPRGWIMCFIGMIVICLPEFQGVIRPFQGLRVVLADWRMQRDGVKQPLAEAIELIRVSGDRGGVAVDYVPQLANWYLPDHPVALVPDRSSRTPLNESRDYWTKLPVEPEWHLFYSKSFNGAWNCTSKCDYHRMPGKVDDLKYVISSAALGQDFEMCVVRRWPTALLNNAPIKEYPDEAVKPEGKVNDELVLARRCR